jgi:hypothetical protein
VALAGGGGGGGDGRNDGSVENVVGGTGAVRGVEWGGSACETSAEPAFDSMR